jgi:hypothetical protein
VPGGILVPPWPAGRSCRHEPPLVQIIDLRIKFQIIFKYSSE